MTVRSIIAAAALSLAAAACATAPTPYAPAGGASSYGYSETRIEADRYSVRFDANSSTDNAVSRDYALLRAAELTLRDGYEWFQIVDAMGGDSERGRSGPAVSVGVGGVSGSRGSGLSTGVGITFGGGRSRAQQEPATLEIKMGKGAKPEGVNVYDAQSVVDSVGARAAHATG